MLWFLFICFNVYFYLKVKCPLGSRPLLAWLNLNSYCKWLICFPFSETCFSTNASSTWFESKYCISKTYCIRNQVIISWYPYDDRYISRILSKGPFTLRPITITITGKKIVVKFHCECRYILSVSQAADRFNWERFFLRYSYSLSVNGPLLL